MSWLARGVGRARRWLAAWPPWLVLVVAWTIVLVYAFPGQMTLDGYDHLREARAGIYTDAHPPIINLTWRLCEELITGPLGMLLLQTGLLLIGLYAILRRTFTPPRAAWWTFALFIFPPVATMMVVIWKDAIMAGLLVVGIAGLLSDRRSRRLLGQLALFGATAFRYNALAATLPLTVLLFVWRPNMHWLARYTLALAIWLATSVAALGLNAALTDKPMHYWHSSLAIFDIAGTLANVPGTLPDDTLRDELAGTQLLVDHDIHAAIRTVYTPRDFFPLLTDLKHRLWILPIDGYEPAPEAQRDAIARAWLDVVTRYPWPFIRHRLAVMVEVLDLRGTRSMGAVVPRELRYQAEATALHLPTETSSLQLAFTRALHWLSRHSGLFTPWVYAILALVMLPLAWRHRDVLALLLSGLGLEASLVPLVHSRDYRYSHWLVLATLLSCIILGARRYRTQHRPAQAVDAA